MKTWAKGCMATLAVLVLVFTVFVNLPVKACEKENTTAVATTANIYGYVKSSRGPSVDGLTVKLYDIYNNNITSTALTVSGGVYSFKNVAPGYYHVRISSQDLNSKVYFETMTDSNSKWVPRLEPGVVRWANFTVYEQDINAHIIGTVTNDASKNPVPASGAIVKITDPAHNYIKTVTTEANGTFDVDYYAGTFIIDITGTGDLSKYSYSGPLVLAGDGEHNATLDRKPVVDNQANPNVDAVIYNNGKSLVEGWDSDYMLNYTAGIVYFYDDDSSQYMLELKNRDVVTADYHYITMPWTKWSDPLTNNWNEWPQLNFTYGHISNAKISIIPVGYPAKDWPAAGNYTLDPVNGTLTILANSTINKGDTVTAKYDTTEKQIGKEPVLISGENKKDFKISEKWIEGWALNSTWEPITDIIDVTLYDKTEPKLLSSSTDGTTNYFTLAVPNSMANHTAILVVHPQGYNPFTIVDLELNFTNNPSIELGQILFTKSDKELFKYDIAFKDTRDWNNITINTTDTWNAGSSLPGIGNESIGNARLQIDLNFGNRNGIVEKTELAAYKTWLEKVTPNYVSTSRFMTLNDSAYNSSTTDRVVAVTDKAGDNAPVNSTDSLEIMTVVKAKVSGKKFDSPKYDVKLTVDYDTATRNSTYLLRLPKYYVRTSSNPDPDNLIIDGYTNVTIDPKESSGSTVVTLVVEKAVNATPAAKILTWNGKDALENETHAYAVTDTNNTYIVARDHNVTFSSDASIPAVGEIIGYNWSFGDGNYSGWTQNKTAIHKYMKDYSDKTKKTVNFTVSLEVKNSLGNITTTNKTSNLTLRVDAVDPTVIYDSYLNKSHTEGVLTFVVVVQNTTAKVKKGYNPTNRTIYTWINEPIIFNASKSYDSMLDSKKKDGTIRYWNYDFGCSNSSGNLTNGLNYTFTGYSKSGMYNITLNVTDVVGRFSRYIITAVVKPQPGFWKWDTAHTNVTDLKEKTKYYFTANVSKGPYSDTIRNCSWTFEYLEDHSKTNFWNKSFVEFTFPNNGMWNITLNTTDRAGNYAINNSEVKVIPGPHPDVMIMSINFSVDTPEEGQEVWISVNISNSPSGSAANATKVVVKIYDDKNNNFKCDAGELIGIVSTFNGTPYPTQNYPNLQPNHWTLAKLKWKPGETGERRIIVNVSCTLGEELSSALFNNEVNKTVYVNPAKWRGWLIIAVFIIIIAVVLILIYLWKTGKLANLRRRRKGRLDTEVTKGKEYKEKWEKEQKGKEGKDKK